MLTTYFKKPLTLKRYRSGSVGSHIDKFTDWLEELGYQHSHIKRLLQGLHHFSLWTQNVGLPTQELNAKKLETFRNYLQSQKKLHYPSGNYSALFVGARHFVSFLEVTGRLLHPTVPPVVSPEPPLLIEFRQWMNTHRGTMATTLNNYRLTLIDLLKTIGDQPEQYNAQVLRAFVLERASDHGVGRAKTMVTAIRMFLRFLVAIGRCAPGLDHAIPTIAHWRLASLPSYLSTEDIERLISSCDLSCLIGLRDQAVLLLLVRLGLRSGDVSTLKLSDIDWQAGTIQVMGKNRQQNRLPLSQDVGDAILRYLEHRPSIDDNHVFLTTIAPLKGLSYQTVGQIATRAMVCSGVETPTHGSHILRRSAASQMLNHNVPLETIGNVLRHASIETTAIYAKIDRNLLQQVARPWPEVTSC